MFVFGYTSVKKFNILPIPVDRVYLQDTAMLPCNKIENRHLDRLILYIKVFDNETNAFLGYTANIHSKGMMLVSETLIPLDKDISIRLEHVKDDFKKIAIPLSARGVWRGDTHVFDVYTTGFRFVDPSHTQIIELDNLFEDLIFHYYVFLVFFPRASFFL